MFPSVRVGGNALAVCSKAAPTKELSMVLSYYSMVLSYYCIMLFTGYMCFFVKMFSLR